MQYLLWLTIYKLHPLVLLKFISDYWDNFPMQNVFFMNWYSPGITESSKSWCSKLYPKHITKMAQDLIVGCKYFKQILRILRIHIHLLFKIEQTKTDLKSWQCTKTSMAYPLFLYPLLSLLNVNWFKNGLFLVVYVITYYQFPTVICRCVV